MQANPSLIFPSDLPLSSGPALPYPQFESRTCRLSLEGSPLVSGINRGLGSNRAVTGGTCDARNPLSSSGGSSGGSSGRSSIPAILGLVQEVLEFASRVDTQHHTSLAMALRDGLSAMEPGGLSSIDDEVLDEEIGLVVGVELVEAGVETTVGGTGGIEVGLSDGVVLCEEIEADGVTYRSVELVGGIEVEALCSNGYVVDFAV